jgi:hypothetical protein
MNACRLFWIAAFLLAIVPTWVSVAVAVRGANEDWIGGAWVTYFLIVAALAVALDQISARSEYPPA